MQFSVSTKGHHDIIDITTEVADAVKKSGTKDGMALIFAPHSTVGITLIEHEEGLFEDMKEVFEKIAPSGWSYKHDERWGEANGYAHILSSLMKPSLVIPVEKGELVLGSWQQIVLIDFDSRPRRREITVKIFSGAGIL